MKSTDLASRLDELLLLRSVAEAQDRYDVLLRQARADALAGDCPIVQSLELLDAKAEVDMLLGLWKLRFKHQPMPMRRAIETVRVDPERARFAGAA